MRQPIVHSCGTIIGYFHGRRALGEFISADDFELLNGERARQFDARTVLCSGCGELTDIARWVTKENEPAKPALKPNIKFKLCSEHKACSFCGAKNVPVVMEMRTGKAICDPCIQQVSGEMKHIGEHHGDQPNPTHA